MRRSRGLPTIVLLAALCFALGSSAQAQTLRPTPDPAGARGRQADALRVFIDCTAYSCDYDYFRTEIDFVNHVRDRQNAQVLALVTAQATSGGGTEYVVDLIGREEFRGADDSLRYVAEPPATRDEVRRRLAALIERGLVRYVNHTPLGDRIRIAYTAPSPYHPSPQPPRDPWNGWAFGTTLNGSINGEKSSRYISLNGSLSANRITEAWKIVASLQGAYSENTVDVSDTTTVTTVSRDYGADALVVKSLGGHWSAGIEGTLTSSTFLNQSLALRLAPAVEYNIFPYSESSRRQLVLQYSVGATAFDYTEETIFGRTAETRVDQRVIATLALTQPWGSVSTSLEGSHYLGDVGKWHGIASNNVDVHLFGGFSLQLLGGLELVHDQLYLARAGASEEEILLRQRQLATSFRYWSSVGFRYTFGSPFANVVNPRFGGSSGGISIQR